MTITVRVACARHGLAFFFLLYHKLHGTNAVDTASIFWDYLINYLLFNWRGMREADKLYTREIPGF